MHRRGFLLSIVAFLALLFLAPTSAHAWNPFRKVRATGHDAVTTAGQPVVLSGKFEKGYLGIFSPDIKGENATFRVNGVTVGSGTTDSDGVAHCTYTPPTTGVFTVEVQLTRKKWKKGKATSSLWVFGTLRTTIVYDIDGTLSSMANWLVPFFGGKANTFPHAVGVAHSLAKDFDIIYLTARDDALANKTYAFLDKHGFPKGPVLFNDWGLTTSAERAQLSSKNHGTFKLGVLLDLKARGIRAVAGIGDSDTDGYAYENANMESFLRTKSGTGPRQKTHYFTDDRVMEQILRAIAKNNGWL